MHSARIRNKQKEANITGNTQEKEEGPSIRIFRVFILPSPEILWEDVYAIVVQLLFLTYAELLMV